MTAAHSRPWDGVEAPAPGRWTIEPHGARVEFVARYFDVARLRGRFRSVSGTVTVAERPEESGLDVAIDAASIHTGIAVLDRVLRTPRFLDVGRHPTLRFRSRRIERVGRTALRVWGDLTIRGTSRPVTLVADYRGIEADRGRGARARFTAAADVDRHAFGVGWRSIMGVPLSGRFVRVELQVDIRREDPP